MFQNQTHKGSANGLATICGIALKVTALLVCVVGLSILYGCGKDKPTQPQTPVVTLISFKMEQGGTSYKVYLDNSLKATFTQVGQVTQVEVSPGSHSYYVKDENCGLSSESKTTQVSRGEQKTISLSSTSLTFAFPKPSWVRASKGLFDNYVRVSWPNIGAPKYEIWRKNGSEDYAKVATISGSLYYDDQAARPVVTYRYKVRGVWSCGSGDWSPSETGYRRSGAFSDTRFEIHNPDRYLRFLTDIQAWGYKGKTLSVGLWIVRKAWGYWFVEAKCNAGTPGNYLGCVSKITPGYEQTKYDDKWCKIPYACFKEQTGTYYAFWRLYPSSNIASPWNTYIAQSDPVSFSWSSGSPAQPEDRPELIVAPLTDEELQEFKRAMSLSEGIGAAIGSESGSMKDFAQSLDAVEIESGVGMEIGQDSIWADQ